jgi:hypothetical protein
MVEGIGVGPLPWRIISLRAYTGPVPCKPTKSPGAPREWRITLVRHKGQYLGRVEAPDEATAIKIAIEEFKVPEAQRTRLIAQPVE